MKHHFVLLTTVENVEVAVNVERIAAIYEHGEYRSLMFSFDGDYIRVKESLGDLLNLVGFAR
jgi:hypothetical protein